MNYKKYQNVQSKQAKKKNWGRLQKYNEQMECRWIFVVLGVPGLVRFLVVDDRHAGTYLHGVSKSFIE